jgi:hypothetical protein
MGLPGCLVGDRVWVPADGRQLGSFVRPAGYSSWGFQMTIFDRALGVGRLLLADDRATSSIRQALLIGLSASAVLVLVRIGTALGAGH